MIFVAGTVMTTFEHLSKKCHWDDRSLPNSVRWVDPPPPGKRRYMAQVYETNIRGEA